MNQLEAAFLARSREKVSDLEHRRKINHALKQSDDAFQKGKEQFSDLAAARRLAKNSKWKAIEYLDRRLEEFEEKFTRHGGKVIWAENAQQALDEIGTICKAKNARTVVKSKSMVTEEIHLNPFLEDRGIDVIETDLGEYIQQLAGEPPYHIVAPSMHKSKEEVAQLFHDKLDALPGLPPRQLTLFARKKLRKKFREAEIGITGVNFLLADIGGVAVTENEGNARLTSSFPKTHIAIAGIEKVLSSVADLHLFWPLLATHGSGQKITVYNSIFTGPKRPKEADGPEEMYVILLNNGRTNILADVKAREGLYCIRCGACLNVCPVYKNIGGHTYNTTYSGPIGAVITPQLRGSRNYKHLSYASSLCGACTEVCPVRINLHELLLDNRQQAVKEKSGTRTEAFTWYAWKRAMLSRSVLNIANEGTKNFFMKNLFKSAWGNERELPVFPGKSFNEQWKKYLDAGEERAV
ncbi:L-lactate dehydrogenase complex protein LldF [Anseongella ginsenosidimutans]|uniref:L-lactate dehydrogenase complex protein LldF n=1 Tax=Anseongella ginsenosidimutans TaxID=496056 RepID=A0A4R3KRN1_9SPHI|nr:LutB/LldF family L-lactate oxidation iron-sulfur protein [Anseongella ginsenosidimutans]QEC53059.1 iron-sulfur cluster-binding protein [Anseongella ginsenosidimutans]TCS87674.1 L-lactate dehydrogenase complex protein LldF [Anseongella ginsenosidimutans]